MRSRIDTCPYFRRQNDKQTVLGLYVDDVLVISQRESDTAWMMNKLAEQLQIKDMGPAMKCLGIHIEGNLPAPKHQHRHFVMQTRHGKLPFSSNPSGINPEPAKRGLRAIFPDKDYARGNWFTLVVK
ncbi:RNA-dependent DNA polymerase [Phytophthora megakarya]|uniref:RNA-dependent DNA polymerase n=1 Tax=Phytophthora megakarya TaxID=4795 RepID=A0A225WG35_9STRA|nr:RNA-dependent DNA polymerase [Phytophthora megakarya]